MPGARPHNPNEAPMHEPIIIRSGKRTWCFRCEMGQEAALLVELARLARDTREPFDWFDAAQAARELARQRAGKITTPTPSLVLTPHSPPHEMQP